MCMKYEIKNKLLPDELINTAVTIFKNKLITE